MGRHLEISEIASLFLAADKQHMKLFILMLIGTAARPKAVLDLQYGQIDFARDIIDPVSYTHLTLPTILLV